MFASAFIFVFVIAALWQFSFAYCRTLLATYSKVELSHKIEKIMGVTVDTIAPGEFDRLMALVRVAPDPGDDATEIAAVSLYYRVIRLAAAISSLVSERASDWCHDELARCSYFAAVTLDRRLVPAADSTQSL
ncbi:MAG TPA: hypothetical protein VEX69_04780 [Candidatus Limnocylindria bacterium]|nr:hypothetical protein [Candidatus Limnocylindria bacterium]